MRIIIIILFIYAICSGCGNTEKEEQNSSTEQNPSNTSSTVKVAGAMKNVMQKGQLYGTIDIDTISDKQDLYGLGPVEYLSGEILIIDGKSYKAAVISDTEMSVEETFKIKAPFLVYANVSNWVEQDLPDSIQTIEELEIYLTEATKNIDKPFAFKLSGEIDSALIHLVNLPEGMEVHSPSDAHTGQKNFQLENEQVRIIGFFSKEHKGVFTHHDTFIHMHLITDDNKKMGHLDDVTLKKGTVKLHLPKE